MVKHICDELESVLSEEGTQPQTPSLPGVVLLKHSKNRDVRAVSHVCRGWRSHATAFACLWRDIAFDIADPKSIRLAKSFLSLVENKDVLLRVYVGFSPENTSPNRSVVKLFGDLRRHIHRWEVFEYQGSLGEFRSYLDLPAPNLRYFSDHRDPSHPRSLTSAIPGYRSTFHRVDAIASLLTHIEHCQLESENTQLPHRVPL